MQNINLKNDQSNCIQTQNQITGTTYINICTDKTTFVPYGSGDWLGVGIASFIIFGMIIGAVKFVKVMSN